MRKIERTTQFKRDYKRESKKPYHKVWLTTFYAVLENLCTDLPLADKHRDHLLTGNWHDHRDCHIRPDLVLIYRLPDENIIQLVRLGSHSELNLG
jgi:mRNA interferase YafQ